MIENERDYLDSLRALSGMPPKMLWKYRYNNARLDYAILTSTEWSPRFETAMRNRLIMGAIRYGRMHAPDKKKRDRVFSAMHRINLYAESGNQEHLVDAANELLLEFEEPMYHEDDSILHFLPADDGFHTPEKCA